ncbi:hypothetical protein FACS189475_02220 [Betaproteobacteria bacterium]|nr:hypothetical protein FACS189475_02220 [Betaproteobacteria bacterium]
MTELQTIASIPPDYETVLDKSSFLFDQISAIAVAHETLDTLCDSLKVAQLRESLVCAIADLAGLGNAECHKMIGQNPQGELPEFEAALGNIWPLFGQISAVAKAYISLNLCDEDEKEKTRDDLASVFDNLAKTGLKECGKWERFEADCRKQRTEDMRHE